MAPTVLLVDDHPGYRAAARTVLEADGFEVVGEAATGLEAVFEAARLRPQIVLLDIGLPDIDGFDVAERMAADGSPDIVLVSSRDPRAYAGRVATSTAVGFIAKEDLDGDGLRSLLASVRR